MNMGVDPARQDQPTAAIELRRRLRKRLPYSNDEPVPDSDIRLEDVSARNDSSASEDEIERHSASFRQYFSAAPLRETQTVMFQYSLHPQLADDAC